jgi:hypothetical protein
MEAIKLLPSMTTLIMAAQWQVHTYMYFLVLLWCTYWYILLVYFLMVVHISTLWYIQVQKITKSTYVLR